MPRLTEDPVRVVVERERIREVLTRYAVALDSRNWDLLDEVFVPDGVAEYPNIGERCEGLPAIKRLVRDTLERLDASQHYLSNIEIELEESSARAATYLLAQHYTRDTEGGDTYTLGGTYHDHLVLTAHGWRIRERRLDVHWTQGHRGVFRR